MSRRAVDRVRRHPLTLLGLLLIGGVTLLALLADVVTPYPEHAGLKINMGEKLRPPSARHPFGTDELGRDVLTRVIYGARVSVAAGVGIVVLTALLGVPLGAIATSANMPSDATMLGRKVRRMAGSTPVPERLAFWMYVR